MVANMHLPVKGHQDLIAAAQIVCRQHSNVRFVLIGDGEMRPILEAQAREMGVAYAIRFLGHRTDVPEILSSCDLGVLASRAEGLPNAVLEYMAAGLATIATPVGGVPEIITHGTNGLLVSAKNPVALSAEICRLLDDDQLRIRLGDAARKTVLAKFDLGELLNNLQQLYAQAFQGTLPVQESGRTIAFE
jgi:glycosyltransferase involved in cell wall biosynthesis